MKRIFAMILTVAMAAALLCACGDPKPESTIESKPDTVTAVAAYDDGYADRFAQSISTDENGNKVYEFTPEQYDAYTHEHNNAVSADIKSIIVENHPAGFGEYVYINEEKKAVMIGVHEGEYDAEIAQEEAPAAAQEGFKFFLNLQQPVDTIRVVYCNAGDQSVEYGSFKFTADK